MSDSSQWTEINGKRLRLSNLDKVLYPKIGGTKAEVIRYYLEVAPCMLPYVKDRPMSFIRFPDGVSGASFYQKDRPANTPDWIQGLKMGQNTIKDYIVINDVADIVWLATMACLEMHQMQVQKSHVHYPDHIVFDLDPSPGITFTTVKEVSFKLKEYLEEQGYATFVKTSGSKGLHLFIPILPNTHADEVKAKSKSLASSFVKENPSIATLHLPKKKRTNKILIDIYRNALYSTVVSPFSLRGKEGAPVSMPISWESLGKVKSAQSFNMKSCMKYLMEKGDPWQNLQDQRVNLKTSKAIQVQMDVPLEKLEAYYSKRDFTKTPEPKGALKMVRSNRFVIHRHQASRLHYDLRLEDEGALKCWALPKGMPYRANEKRLAVQTEDHPVSYLSFKGSIPKGQYGAGEMDIWQTGTFEWISRKKKSYSFLLKSAKKTQKYLIYQLNKEQWLIECKNEDLPESMDFSYEHMLAKQVVEVPDGPDWLFEVKWDGIRVFLYIDDLNIQIKSRSGRDITETFPKIVEAASKLQCHTAILDGEIVVLDEIGRSVFKNVISRMHTKGAKKIAERARTLPAVLYVFDLIFLDGQKLFKRPLNIRQKWLAQVVSQTQTIRASESVVEGESLFYAAKEMELEGIMAKRIKSTYQAGERSSDWVKIKFRNTTDCIILGFTSGQGNRHRYFGSLHLGEFVDGAMVYRGRVGTGFDSKGLATMHQILLAQPITKKPFTRTIQEERSSTWISPTLRCEIQYASMTDNGTYREPVFKRLLEDENEIKSV